MNAPVRIAATWLLLLAGCGETITWTGVAMHAVWLFGIADLAWALRRT